MCYRVNSDNSGRATGVVVLRPRRLRQHDRGRARHPDAVHLRQHPPAAAVEDRQVPERARQFERPARQAHHGAHDGERVRRASTTATSTSSWARARRSTRSTTSTPTISTTAASASSAARRSRSAPATSRAARSAPTTMAPPPGVPRWGAAYRDFLAKYFTRHAAMVAQTENLPYADQTIDLDPERARRLGPAGAAHDLRLAAAERARARRIHAEEDGGDRPRDGRAAWSGARRSARRRAGRAPRRRHPHGQRSEDLGGEPLRPELGHSEPVRHRQLDLPDA